MKTLRILTLAALASSVIVSAAYAGGDQAQRRIGEENAAYFAQKANANDSSMTTKKATADSMKQDMQNSSASQYPCAGCTYDEKAGGYVQNPHAKR
jgi:hypothetical protein